MFRKALSHKNNEGEASSDCSAPITLNVVTSYERAAEAIDRNSFPSFTMPQTMFAKVHETFQVYSKVRCLVFQ